MTMNRTVCTFLSIISLMNSTVHDRLVVGRDETRSGLERGLRQSSLRGFELFYKSYCESMKFDSSVTCYESLTHKSDIYKYCEHESFRDRLMTSPYPW